ncbi:MAG: MFS transporter [Lewinella sp.]|nr:MFS transporter [Lewinella sp.]
MSRPNVELSAAAICRIDTDKSTARFTFAAMIPRLHLRLSVLMFLQFFLWGSWFVTTGTYLLEHLDFNGRQVGLVYGTAAIAATVSPFMLGVLADRLFAAERLLAGLHLTGGLLMWGMSMSEQFATFYPLVLLYMLCYMPTFGLANALSFHHLSDVKGQFPRIRVWGTVGWILAGLLVSYLGVETEVVPLRIAAGVSALQGLYCLTLPHTPPAAAHVGKGMRNLLGPEVMALLKDRSFLVLLLSLMLICIPSAYYYSFVNPFLVEIGETNAAGKMAIGQVTEIIFMLTLPWFFQRLRLKVILFWGLLAWGVRYGCFALGILPGWGWLIYLGLGLHGLAFIFSMLAAQIYLDTRVPHHLRSTAQGFYSLLTLGLGALVGAYIAGETVTSFTLGDGHDWARIWQIPTWWGIIVAIAFFFLFRSKQVVK